MDNPAVVRDVVMRTVRGLFDRAAESFRAAPDGDHYFESLHAAMVALQYAGRVSDEQLAEIMTDVPPRYYVRTLCIHREQQKHITRWDE